jgi:hypothetical protein
MTALTVLDRLVATYGDAHRRTGILSEHRSLAAIAGLRERKLAAGTSWLVAADGRAFPVLCSELIEVATEDGPVSGRCGALASDPLGMCPGHTYAATGSEEPDIEESCPHGLSAWLCAGPLGHYPTDI